MHQPRFIAFILFVASWMVLLSLEAGRTMAPVPPPPRTDHESYTETIPGSKVKFRMNALPGGTFHFGSPPSEKGRGDDEGPRHPVKVRPFWMGACEVTWDEFDRFRQDKEGEQKKKPGEALFDAITRPSDPYLDETWGFGREGYPVIGISHHAAMEYCRWLSWATGRRYRLPTEVEWEYACRAGTKSPWSHGDDRKKLAEHAWFRDNAEESTHPIGKKKPNAWGLHDMHGNVGEWCVDGYRKDRYRDFSPDRLSPSPVQLPGTERYPHVVRGGSWLDAAEQCRSAVRLASNKQWNKRDPDRHKSIWWLSDVEFIGFRVVRAVEEHRDLRDFRSQVTKESPE